MFFEYKYYFISKKINKNDLYINHLKAQRDEFEVVIDKMRNLLKINGDRFDTTVIVNVNIFEGYTTDELCKIFEDINKYGGGLTEIELLASSLYNINDFIITDSIIKENINVHLIDYYSKRKEGEVLECYEYDSCHMNAYDFIVGLQNYAHSKCSLIEKVNNDHLSLFFKVYKTLYKGYDVSFTTLNVNNFIEYIEYVIIILNKIEKNVFTRQLFIGNKAIDKCNDKLESLKTNNLFIIIVSIIGFFQKKEDEKIIINSIEKCILFHFFVKSIKSIKGDEELTLNLKRLKTIDTITYEAGGRYIDNVADSIYKSPEKISNNITIDSMCEVIDLLINQSIKNKIFETRNGGKDKYKRRERSYFEMVLIYYFYKNIVPTQFLSEQFSIEHIIPFSSSWDNEIDIDRLGNIIPIIHELNSKRGNKHISYYHNIQINNGFVAVLHRIIPTDTEYDKIVYHPSCNSKPKVINNDEYKLLYSNNENTYKDVFLSALFK